MLRKNYKSRRSYAVCSPSTLWSLTRLRYLLSFILYILFDRWFVLQKPIKPSLESIQILTSTSLSKEVYSLTVPHEKKTSPFICFELASSQFPWYHLAAILEERVNNQSLVAFSRHSSLNRPLPNHDQNLHSLYFHHLWVLSAFIPCSLQQSSHIYLM